MYKNTLTVLLNFLEIRYYISSFHSTSCTSFLNRMGRDR